MTEHRAGLSDSALIAEISIDTDTATANWRNSCPLIPGMNATGTNTDSKTRVIAMIGPVIWAIAFFVASGIESSGSSSITRSTFSMTTIASSTTMPIARTSANSETVFAEKPIPSMTANVPMIETGTATSGISVVRSLPRNRNTTRPTRMNASISVRMTSRTVALTKTVVSKKTL